jgi:diadenosine tetraphosphate (Ap4A) HIT family hydrolase
MSYIKDCEGCKISLNQKKVSGGIIELGKYWIANHYMGNEGFLGWLALQPKEHYIKMQDLPSEVAEEMGIAIKNLSNLLTKYWEWKWKDDNLERIYVTYFFESFFNTSETKYHLHIHLIPRTKKLKTLISENGQTNCWSIPNISKSPGFPANYKKDNYQIMNLMDKLRKLNK